MAETFQEFLLEIGSEEIPAWMIPSALSDLKRLLTEGLEKLGLTREQAITFEMFGTPRRLVAYCPALSAHQPKTEETVQGPPRRVAYDAAGKPTPAAVQFAAKMGTRPEKLQTVSTPKGEYLAFKRIDKGRPTAALLSELIPQAVAGIYWPRAMYWESKTGPHFIRPIRWLLALYGGKVIPCSVGSVKAAKFTNGHRQLGKSGLPVTAFAGYHETLRKNFVILDPAARRARIEEQTAFVLGEEGGNYRVRPNPELLQTLTYLTEFPTPLVGSFDASYLTLPEEVLVTVMRGHQKYFAVERSDGKMAPRFIAVMEADGDPTGIIRHGHERVLRARFNDARFFWETDGKIPLEKRVEMLASVTFQSKLGSYAEKSARMQALADELALRVRNAGMKPDPALQPAISKAARLAKCDLTTDLVKEFTELQGVVGGLCARRDGLSDEIATAIYDHYRPQSMEDALPRTLAGDIVSLADRMDTLVGCFGVGLAPTGSKDPFGLRRAAQGVIRILAEKQLPHTLDGLVGAACEVYHRAQFIGEASAWDENAAREPLLAFLEERVAHYLREVRGFAYDEVDAVMSAGASESRGAYDLPDLLRRVDAVARIRPTENFEPLAAAFKRMRNILQQAAQTVGFEGGSLSDDLLREEAEQRLFERAQAVGQRHFGSDYFSALEAIASLRPDVDLFFDKILVMDKDPDVRNNRLGLLEMLLTQFSKIADFSKIVPKETAKAATARAAG